MAEMEVSPQEEMANPQGMKFSPLREIGFLKILWSAVVATRICAESAIVRYSGRHRESLCASVLRFLS